jgi:hypothetical protein
MVIPLGSHSGRYGIQEISKEIVENREFARSPGMVGTGGIPQSIE